MVEPPPHPRAERLLDLCRDDGRDASERRRLVRLMMLLGSLPSPPDPDGDFPAYSHLRGRFLEAAAGDDGELLEEAFLELYAHLHMSTAPYTTQERQRVDASGGYWCHAGGLSPLLRARPWISQTTVSTDLGAGNGLQLLLLQKLHPHRLSIQIEISNRMAAIGRRLQSWLEIPVQRVRWVVDDVMDAALPRADFVYLYRPVRPTGVGRAFYERLADHLTHSPTPVVVFSIADCLRDFLPPDFEIMHSDGHLTCIRGPAPPPPQR